MKTLDEVEAELRRKELEIERERGVVEALVAQGKAAQAAAQVAADNAIACEQAALLLASYSDQRQAEVVTIIENIASKGLTQVFDEDIQLVISMEKRARRSEMDVKVRTGNLETSILDARGGGLAAVAGFLLRACVLLLTPDARKLMVLDEVFAMLSEDYVPRMAEFLAELCDSTGLQVLLVTHQPEFADAAHSVHRIEKIDLNTSRFVKER